jgi:hypothetical protein
MITKLSKKDAITYTTLVDKLNELIEAYNLHIHYARELQMPTSIPDEPNVYGTN